MINLCLIFILISDKFPGLLTFGCVIYGLNSILDRILTLPEIVKMIDVIKKLYSKIEKSQELKSLVEEAAGKKHVSPYDSTDDEAATANNARNNNNVSKPNGNIGATRTGNNSGCSSPAASSNHSSPPPLTKWKLAGKVMSQLISEKAVYQKLLSNPDSKKVLDGLSSDSPNGKSDRDLSNHLSSESYWTR